MLICKTGRLTLRELQLSDAEFALRLYNDPSFLQHIGDKGVRTLEDAEQNLQQGAIASYARHGYGMWLVENQQGQAIGLCGLIKRDFLAETDLGYAYLPEFFGLGYAYEAAKAVLAYAAGHSGLKTLVAIVSQDNQASKALLLKLGFEQDGQVLVPDKNEMVDFYRIHLTKKPDL
ncbi:MAG: GNAT family N-acetyltransferase [Gammaproteobacteria bacterium]|nr:GNAT family N-acetyltransferase [Gammaproteobacteria bacterium]MBU2056798.1 GNAT family N-acetyltransferase [Gammaproteobacteria bacterium]MBU2174135.1 GNAT family N-acetyltransferase [Gammaproteobacteria bacterium]MBU2246959.1 GNAT family N-acetyltransferase [Gammaproteobacteria bacterium]MBU2344076.1 GNAT family N-acetyltransferase [Gammaproteobacteria bacterium]